MLNDTYAPLTLTFALVTQKINSGHLLVMTNLHVKYEDSDEWYLRLSAETILSADRPTNISKTIYPSSSKGGIIIPTGYPLQIYLYKKIFKKLQWTDYNLNSIFS